MPKKCVTKVRKTTTGKGKKGSTWQGCYTEKSKAKPKAKPKKPKRHPEWGGEGKPSREQYLQFLQDKKSKWHLSKYKHYTTGITGTHWPESHIAVFHEAELKRRKGTPGDEWKGQGFAGTEPSMRHAGFGAGPTSAWDKERLYLQHKHPVGTYIRIDRDDPSGLEQGQHVEITKHTEKGFEVKPDFGPPRVIDPNYYRGDLGYTHMSEHEGLQRWGREKGYDF